MCPVLEQNRKYFAIWPQAKAVRISFAQTNFVQQLICLLRVIGRVSFPNGLKRVRGKTKVDALDNLVPVESHAQSPVEPYILGDGAPCFIFKGSVKEKRARVNVHIKNMHPEASSVFIFLVQGDLDQAGRFSQEVHIAGEDLEVDRLDILRLH